MKQIPFGDGLRFGVDFWGTALAVVTVVACTLTCWEIYDNWSASDFGKILEKSTSFSLVPIAVLGVIWKVFQTKFSAVYIWSEAVRRKYNENEWKIALGEYCENNAKIDRLEFGVKIWGLTLVISFLGSIVLVALKSTHAIEIGKAIGPIILGIGLIWQVFLSDMIDAKMSEFESNLENASSKPRERDTGSNSRTEGAAI